MQEKCCIIAVFSVKGKVHKDLDFLQYDTLQCVTSLFRTSMLPLVPSQPWFLPSFLYLHTLFSPCSLMFCPEDGGICSFHNICFCLPYCMLSDPIRYLPDVLYSISYHIYCLENADFSKLYLNLCFVILTGVELLQCLDSV